MAATTEAMSRATLLARLGALRILSISDAESAHSQADEALLIYIGDPEIRKAFEAINRWYA